MNTEHLREYVELARQLNFTATARTMHITQPALSNHIHQLEKETGVLLVERSINTGARLTPAGQALLGSARKIVEELDDTLPRLREIQRNTAGRIIIRTPRNEYSMPLLTYVYEFRRLHPNVNVILSPWVDTDGIMDVKSGAVDCAYVGYSCGSALKDVERANRAERSAVELVAYADTEILLWVDRKSPYAQGVGDGRVLDGHEVVIPANQKRDSWALGINSVGRKLGISLPLNEKYCDSLEDLLLDKVVADDVLLCDADLFKSSAFGLRPDRVAVSFDPPLLMPISLAYATDHNDENSLALRMFVEFLEAKYDPSGE